MSSRPSRRSLAGAFRPTAAPAEDRAVALVGLLPPRNPARMQPAASQDEGRARGSDADVRGGPPAGAERAGEPVGGSPAPGGGDDSTRAGRVRNVAVYLPVDLLRRLRETARLRELTYADLLVEAASAHLEDVAPQFAPTPPPSRGGGMPSRAPRRAPAPGVQVQFRLDGHQVAWLDEQVARLGAPSRTALVAALLRAHLGAASPS
jgi:hypothetical protein